MTLRRDLIRCLEERGCFVLHDEYLFLAGKLTSGQQFSLLPLDPGEPLSYRRQCILDARAKAGMLAAVVRSVEELKLLLDRAMANKISVTT